MATTKATTEKKKVASKVTKKKVAAPKEVAAPKVTKTAAKADRYLYAVGRRKTAVAQVRLYPAAKTKDVMVNDKTIRAYFGTPALETVALSPLKVVGMEETFSVTVLVRGGGLHGQADAVKLGVARALLKQDINLRAVLKAQGMLTRDARAVERKKPGLKKARRAPQWSKR
jgi:small subunit ribosomal protein S9